MNAIIIQGLIHALASYVLGSGILDKAEAAYDKWADKSISDEELHDNVRSDLKEQGLLLSEEAIHHAIIFIELLIKHGAKQ